MLSFCTFLLVLKMYLRQKIKIFVFSKSKIIISLLKLDDYHSEFKRNTNLCGNSTLRSPDMVFFIYDELEPVLKLFDARLIRRISL